MRHIKDGLTVAIAEDLATRLPGQVYAGRRSESAILPYTVVVVKRMTTEVDGDAWVAPVHIVHVSDMDDSGSEEHDLRVRELQDAIRSIPKRGVDEDNGICIFGWTFETVEDATEEDGNTSVWGDVFMLSVGVGEYSG